MMTTDLLTSTEAAHMLGVSPDRVRQLARSGHLQALRVGRRRWRLFRLEDVEALARERRSKRGGAS